MSSCVIALLECAALVEFIAEATCKKHITFGVTALVTLHVKVLLATSPPADERLARTRKLNDLL